MRRVDHVAERVAVLGDVDDERVDVADLVADARRRAAADGCCPAGRRRGAGRRGPRLPAPGLRRRRRRRRPRRARRSHRLLRLPGSAVVRPSRIVMLLGSAVVAVDAAADARRLRRWPGQSSASACSVPSRPGRRPSPRRWRREYDTVWNPEFGRPYTEIGRDPDAPWTSDEFTHIARIQCWYEDCLARSAREAPLLRHRRVHDGAVPPGLSRRADPCLRRPARAALRPLLRLRARRAVEARRDQGVRGAAALDARAVPRAGGGERVAVGAARGAAGGAAAGELERGGSACLPPGR